MIVKYKNRKVEIPVKRVSVLGKFCGLMFKGRGTYNLLFEFERKNLLAIHSFFVFFDFLAVWLDDKDNVLEYKIVRPFALHICPKKSFHKLIEVPLNRNNNRIIEFFVGKR